LKDSPAIKALEKGLWQRYRVVKKVDRPYRADKFETEARDFGSLYGLKKLFHRLTKELTVLIG